MSVFFNELEKNNENPGEHWGRFSTQGKSNETNCENDEVCLITDSNRTQKRGCKKRANKKYRHENTVEIENSERTQPKSSRDRKPGDYVDGSNFVIPKTKHQTSLESGHVREGRWLNAQKRCRRWSIATNAESSNQSDNDISSNTQFAAKKRWLHAKLPENVTNEDVLQHMANQYNSDYDDQPDDRGECESKLDINAKRFPKSFKHRLLPPLCKSVCQHSPNTINGSSSCDIDQGKESIQQKVKKTNQGLTMDEIFCSTCGEGLTNNGCIKCKPQELHEFPSIKNFYGTKGNLIRYTGGKNNAMNKDKKIKTGASLDIKKKTNMKNKDNQNFRAKAKKLKSEQPELVQISSDEDHSDNTMAVQNNSITDEEIMKNNERSVLSTDTLAKTILEMNNSAETMNNDNITSYHRDHIVVEFPVTNIYVGQLVGKPLCLVKITAQHILIKMSSDDQELRFVLGENDLKSFKVSNDGDALFVVIEPTLTWARQINMKYCSYEAFIDPESSINQQKQIVLILEKQIPLEQLADLVELINECLGNSRMCVTISPVGAKRELKRLLCNSPNEIKYPISSSYNELPTTVVSPRKLYDTRSKEKCAHKTNNSSKLSAEKVLIYPASSKKGGVTITTEDMECLEPETYLNDVIIDFFLKYLSEEIFSMADQERTHIFSSFFYKRLTFKKQGATKESRSAEAMHSSVKTWTKNVDIFSKDFLVVPINECAHWYLAIICFPGLVAKQNKNLGDDDDDPDESRGTSQESLDQITKESCDKTHSKMFHESDSDNDASQPDALKDQKMKGPESSRSRKRKMPKKPRLRSRPCILLFDSLSQTGRSGVLVNLRNYLACEWRERKSGEHQTDITFDKKTLKASFVKVPGQDNSSDCGLFLCQYVESFFTTPIKDYNFPINIPNWFPIEIIQGKREYIKNIIYDLREQIHS